MSFSSQGIGNAKVGSQEIPGIIDKFGLGVQNEAGQKLIEFCQDYTFEYKKSLYIWTSPDVQY